MIYTIRITKQAEDDLRGIFEYIAYDLQSPLNAAHQLNRLEEHICGLDQMPDRHKLYAKDPWRSRDLRILPVDNYLVFYIPNHKDMTVTIIRVMYGKRDIDSQLTL